MPAAVLAVILLVGLIALVPGAHADAAKTPQKRVVGGQPTTIAEWPWQVAILQRGPGSALSRQFCGGSLLTPTIVLTAAHCIHNDTTGTFTPAALLSVATGRTALSSPAGQEIDVTAVHLLRGGGGQVLYNPNNNAYDVELLELAQPSSAGTIKLAGADEGDLWTGGRTGYVTGWGSTIPSGGGYPDGLRMAQVRMFSDAECAGRLGHLLITSVMVCAGAPPSRDTCDGDSGGPLVVPMAAGGYRLVGDTSFGLNEDCGRSPSAYGRVGADPLRSLIRNKVNQLTGIDVVGSGGDPPGGGDTLTAAQAEEAAFAYSERTCNAHKNCRRYWAGKCVAQGGGFVCQVRNYDRKRRKKLTCKRKVSVTAGASGPIVKPLNRWSCRRGWRLAAAGRLG